MCRSQQKLISMLVWFIVFCVSLAAGEQLADSVLVLIPVLTGFVSAMRMWIGYLTYPKYYS